LFKKDKEALSICDQALTKFPNDDALWLLKIKMADQKNTKEVQKMFQEALKNVGSDSPTLWQPFLEHCLLIQMDFNQILEYFTKAITSPKVVHIKESFLESVMQVHGIEKARQVYQLSFTVYPTSLEFYERCIQIETEAQDIVKRRALYERALLDHGKTAQDMWLDFMKWEQSLSNFKQVSILYWRAKKELVNPTDFVQKAALDSMQE